MPGEDVRWLGRLGARDDRDLALGDRCRRHRRDRRDTQGLTAWLLGSSYALGLAVIAGLLDMIPNIGATIAGFILVPALWAEEGITAAIIMLVVLLVYQQVENNILTPKIQGEAVKLSGFFIIVAVTFFGALLGVLGALTAVPLAATVQIFIQELTKARREKRRSCEGSARRGLRALAQEPRDQRRAISCPGIAHLPDESLAQLLLRLAVGARSS